MTACRTFPFGTAVGPASAGIVLVLLVAGCGRKSNGDVMGPEPAPPSPVFEYVRQMIDDPWFVDSLPARLDEPDGVAIRDALGDELRQAVEARSLSRLEGALSDLERGMVAYRARAAFDPAESPTLGAFALFVAQARAIRDGDVDWFPAPLLRRDGG